MAASATDAVALPREVATHQVQFDALRGLAAIAVLLAHVCQIFLWRLTGEESTLAVISGNLARHAVLIFFLLSGYLITGSILSNLRRHGRFDVREYLTARIARIYPPLLGAIAITVLVGLLLDGQMLGSAADLYQARSLSRTTFDEVLRALMMQDGLLDLNGPLWTLYIEFHLYLVAGLAALAWSGRSWLGGAAAAVLLTFYLWQTPEFALFAGVWGLGAVAALAPTQMRAVRWLAAGVAGTLIVAAFVAPAVLSVGHPNWGAAAQLGFSLVYLWLIFLRAPFRVPAWAVGTASYSYTLYVIHFPLLVLALWLSRPWLGSWGSSLAVATLSAAGCVLVAYGLARVVEDQSRFKPAIRRALGATA